MQHTVILPGWIKTLYLLHDGTMLNISLGTAYLGNLVACAVEYYAGVIVVLLDHLSRRVLPILGEIKAEVVGILGLVPHIAKLVHYQNAHIIAGPEKGWPRRMVSAPDSVKSRRFQLLHAKTLGIV